MRRAWHSSRCPAWVADPATLAPWFLAVVGTPYTLALMLTYWPGSISSGITSGVWTCLASDFAHGECYRPLWDARGYGGTRYMPLFFVLQGLGIRGGLDPVISGMLLVQLSVAALAAGLYALLRALHVPLRMAVPLAVLVVCNSLYQQICTSIKADHLATALVVWSLVALLACVRGGGTRLLVVAATLQCAAFFTKASALYALPLGAWYLWVNGRSRAACGLLLAVVGGNVAGAALVEAASGGHFSENIRFTLSGGTDMAFALGALARLGTELTFFHPDVGILAALAIPWAAWRGRRGLPETWVALGWAWAALVAAILILASRGTVYNHLVDLHAACILVFGLALAGGGRWARAAGATLVLLAVGLLATLLPGIPSEFETLARRGRTTRACVQALGERYLARRQPYLCVNAIVPILNGERACLLDTFNLDLLVRTNHPAGRDLVDRIERGAFGAVVLDEEETFPRDVDDERDPLIAEREEEFWTRHGDQLPGPLRRCYRIVAVKKPYLVLYPRPR